MTTPLRTISFRPRSVAVAVLTPLALVAGGLSLTASSASPAEATTTTTKLTSLRPVKAVNGWGPYELNKSNGTRKAGDGRTMKINGQKYYSGLGVHSSSKITYSLGGRYTTFATSIGLDDEIGTRGAVRFKVLRDGRTAYTSPVMTGRDKARSLSISVLNTKTLSLVVEPLASKGSDHADWANPRLTAKKPPKPPVVAPTSTTTSSTSKPPTSTTTSSTTSTTTSTTTSSTSKPPTSTTTSSTSKPPTSTTTSSTTATTPTTPSSSMLTSFPSAANTGVPAGTVLKASGSLTISTPGVVSGLNVTGRVLITASDVTFQRSKVSSNNWTVIEVSDSAKNVVIQDVEVDGRGTAGSEGSTGIYGPAKVLRTNIHGIENGIQPSSGSYLQDNYIHAMNSPGDPHIDGIQIDGARHDIVVRHNTVDMRGWTQTATVMIDNYFGPAYNIAVDKNLLLGGGYIVYSAAAFDGGPISGISFTDNRMGDGHWGYASIEGNTPVWTGNVDNTTGSAIRP